MSPKWMWGCGLAGLLGGIGLAGGAFALVLLAVGLSAGGPDPVPGAEVVINGRALTADQVRELQQRYGFTPPPGRFWYDARSGAVGPEGGLPTGALQPGHDFGPLAETASQGSTGVFVNGRQIRAEELAFYQSLVGRVEPGRYWLDAASNVGVEGNPVPVANLMAVAARAPGGVPGGGPVRAGSPADAWLSGQEWSGEARIGGMPMSSGTWDPSGEGNHVISVDGEVLDLPY